MRFFDRLAKKALFSLDPERGHKLSIAALKTGVFPACVEAENPKLTQTIAGLEFSNPVGLAAGYDKNGEVPDAALKLGFGHVEIGTITPKPQDGNPKPRLFRLIKDEAVINRMGFNNDGHDRVRQHLLARNTLSDKSRSGPVGINIGANKDSADFIADYEKGIAAFGDLADYFTVNISSPNTPGLRDLQAADALGLLLERAFAARDKLADKREKTPPVFLKLAPDIKTAELPPITEVIAASKLDGVIISNTTLSRHGLFESHLGKQTGGLSGKPLFERSTIMLARLRKALPEHLPLIGVGGVDSAQTTWEKLEAGAALVQLYSALVYKGPFLSQKINAGLIARLDKENLPHISVIIGQRTNEWAHKKLPEEI